nr:MAG TPA: hypothetical protein [Caudoviricetes sp.]
MLIYRLIWILFIIFVYKLILFVNFIINIFKHIFVLLFIIFYRIT